MVIIYKNNLLNNYNKETELTPSSTHFSNNNYNDTNNDKDDNHKKYENIIKVFSIDFSKIDIKKDMIVYSTLLFFILMSIFFGILNKKMDVIISSILISYITLYLLSKIFLLQNTRYTNIAVWNLYSSLSMLFKSINNDNSDDNQLKIDYYKIIQYSIILYFSSLVIGFIPTISFLNVLSIISLLISYILAFSNKDLDVIQEFIKEGNMGLGYHTKGCEFLLYDDMYLK